MDPQKCGRCGGPRDTSDNFCRSCGHQFTVNLPAVRSERLPSVRSGIPPSLVGSVAVLAVGTGIEWLARRLVGTTARAAGRALITRDRSSDTNRPAPRRDDDLDDVTVDEVLYVRKIQLRR